MMCHRQCHTPESFPVRRMTSLLILGLVLLNSFGTLIFPKPLRAADNKYGPDDPIASLDGNPIYLGELNLILVQRLRAKDLSNVPLEVQQATATLLVRQHKAFETLKQQGGQAIQAIIDREIRAFETELKRRGSSLEKHAQLNRSNEQSVRDNMGWHIAWREYLKSRMTEKNLKVFFERHRERYAGGRWDVSQIFIPIDTADATNVAIGRQRMERIEQELRQATDLPAAFAAAARDQSEAGSAKDGGRMGWVTVNGDVPRVVMNAIQKTQPGELSDIVQGSTGLHLVLVHSRESNPMPFEKLADQSALRRDAANALFDALVIRQSGAKLQWYISALKPPTQ